MQWRFISWIKSLISFVYYLLGGIVIAANNSLEHGDQHLVKVMLQALLNDSHLVWVVLFVSISHRFFKSTRNHFDVYLLLKLGPHVLDPWHHLRALVFKNLVLDYFLLLHKVSAHASFFFTFALNSGPNSLWNLVYNTRHSAIFYHRLQVC